MLKLLKYLQKKDWVLVGASVIFIVSQVWLDLELPDYMSSITTLVQTPGSTIGQILEQGAYMLLCALGSLISSICVGFFAARIAASFSRNLRGKVFEKTMSFSMEEINRFSTASLITRSTNDIQQVQMVIAMGLQVMIKAPILAVWAIIKIADKNWQWTLATAVGVVVLVCMLIVIMTLVLPRFKKVQILTDNLNRVTRENLTGVRVVRAYNAEQYQQQKFDKANSELTSTHLFTMRVMAIMNPGMNIIMSGLSLAIYWIGAFLINQAGLMDRMGIFSNMVVFSSYAVQVIVAFTMLTMIFIMLPRAAVSAKRICDVLDTKPAIIEGDVTEVDTGLNGTIEFKNVSFKYPGSKNYVLEDISFTASKGETVAFIGATGSGKSTLINLIPRFYDATEGEVLVNGINVRDYKSETLNNLLGYVSQRAVMFSGSVKSNVAYGDGRIENYTDQMVNDALDIAQASEFVSKLENGIEAPIAQGGTNVSGGQRQRLSIARAVCRDPEIYIFDDSFSALDYKTDRVLRQALNQKLGGATRLIVAQRIGTIRDADKIIVLDNGRMVGMGTHDQLLKTCDTYREIALSQLSEEELKNAE